MTFQQAVDALVESLVGWVGRSIAPHGLATGVALGAGQAASKLGRWEVCRQAARQEGRRTGMHVQQRLPPWHER